MNITDKLLLFGNEFEFNSFDSNKAKEIIEEAYAKVSVSSLKRIEYIQKVLDKVSAVWANPMSDLRIEATKILQEITSFSSEITNQALDLISKLCSKDYTLDKINFELGALDYLNEGLEIKKNKLNSISNYKVKAIPKGVLLHINSGNLFFEIIESLISGILTKNINIVLMEKKYNVFLKLFLESIRESDELGCIYPSQSIICFNELNEETKQILYNGADCIIYNGNYDLLDSLKSKLVNKIKVIENLNLFSFAVIEGKFVKQSDEFNIFHNIALDTFAWNQKTPYSPQVVYVIDKDLKSTHLLIESLFDSMLDLSEEIPIGNLTFDEKVKIRRLRELAKMSQVKDEGRIVCPDDFSFTLILEYNPEFRISCLNRTLYIKRVLNIDNLFEHLLPLSGNFQTAGICVSDEVKPKLERDLINLGVKRITNIGDMCKKSAISLQNGNFILREIVDWVSFC